MLRGTDARHHAKVACRRRATPELCLQQGGATAATATATTNTITTINTNAITHTTATSIIIIIIHTNTIVDVVPAMYSIIECG